MSLHHLSWRGQKTPIMTDTKKCIVSGCVQNIRNGELLDLPRTLGCAQFSPFPSPPCARQNWASVADLSPVGALPAPSHTPQTVFRSPHVPLLRAGLLRPCCRGPLLTGCSTPSRGPPSHSAWAFHVGFLRTGPLSFSKNKQTDSAALRVKQRGSFHGNEKRENSFLRQNGGSHSPLCPWLLEQSQRVVSAQWTRVQTAGTSEGRAEDDTGKLHRTSGHPNCSTSSGGLTLCGYGQLFSSVKMNRVALVILKSILYFKTSMMIKYMNYTYRLQGLWRGLWSSHPPFLFTIFPERWLPRSENFQEKKFPFPIVIYSKILALKKNHPQI